MEGTKRHAALGQVAVDRGNAEREHRFLARIATFETRDAISKIGNGSVGADALICPLDAKSLQYVPHLFSS